MKRWSWHRTRALLLAVLLGLGMSLSFVQGSAMVAGMAIAADDAHHKPSGCDGCGGSDHNDMNAGTCLTVCASAAQALISGELLPLLSASGTAFQVAHLLLSDQSHSPDHGPPKIP
jgi:hypothetical protein